MSANGCATWARRRDTRVSGCRTPERRKSAMTLTRQMTFWVLTLLVGVVALYILRQILLPFVAGMALSYLLDPLANRLERLGVNRLVASIAIIGAFVLGFVILLLLFVPGLVGQLGAGRESTRLNHSH